MGYKRKYEIDDNYFDVINTQDKAYIFGLFYADGCNYENEGKFKIDLQEDDISVLIKIKDAMKYSGELKIYEQPDKYFSNTGKYYKSKNQVRFIFNSKRISEQLSKKGCTYNKSFIGEFPKDGVVPDDLLRHFIRGYMDGNGGISYWIDNKNTGHKKFQINFCGTIDIINHLNKIFKDKFNCCPAISDRFPDRDNNNLQMNICGNKKVRKILDWIYEDANIYIERKYNKYLELIDENKRIDNNTNLYGNAYPRRPVINLETKEIYSGVNAAGAFFGISGSTIFKWCHKHKNVMYLDEYKQLYGKNY